MVANERQHGGIVIGRIIVVIVIVIVVVVIVIADDDEKKKRVRSRDIMFLRDESDDGGEGGKKVGLSFVACAGPPRLSAFLVSAAGWIDA